jgi:hypothetical protein
MEQAESAAGAILAGVRVIELADWVAGPFPSGGKWWESLVIGTT